MSEKFASVPQPVGNIDSLYEAVVALKQNIEMLTGQSGTDATTAVTASALPELVRVVTDNEFTIAAIEQINELSAYLQTQINSATTELQNNIDAVQEESQSAYNDLNDALNTEEQNRISADQVINVNISSLQSLVNNNTAAITTEAATRATADTALSGRIDSVTASASTNAAAISSEVVTRANADSALSASLTTVSAVASRQRVFSQTSAPTAQAVGDLWIDTANGNLIKYWDGTSWLARDDTRIATNVAAISSESIARANADSAITATVNSLTSTVNGNTASINSEASTRATADTALGGRIDSLTTTVSNNTAAINNEAVARSAADGSLAAQINSVSAQSSAGTASGKYQLVAVSANDGAAAEFSVKVSADGSTYAEAGMRLQVLSNGTSRVVFDTSQFIVRSGASSTKVPFAISGSDLVGNFQVSSNNVYGLGAFATANKINSGNIATYIETAAISDAYINNINANKIVASSLSSISANLGTVTTGLIQSPSSRVRINLNSEDVSISAPRFSLTNDAGSTTTPFVVDGGIVYIDQARIKRGVVTQLASGTGSGSGGSASTTVYLQLRSGASITIIGNYVASGTISSQYTPPGIDAVVRLQVNGSTIQSRNVVTATSTGYGTSGGDPVTIYYETPIDTTMLTTYVAPSDGYYSFTMSASGNASLVGIIAVEYNK